MGTIRLPFDVAREGTRDFSPAGLGMVDTGSELTWVPADVLREIGVDVAKPGFGFRLADGSAVYRDVGFALVRCEGFVTVDEVVFAEPGDMVLIGARTLEGFHAVIDPSTKRLTASTEPILAVANRS